MVHVLVHSEHHFLLSYTVLADLFTNELKDGDGKVAYVSVNDLEQEQEMK